MYMYVDKVKNLAFTLICSVQLFLYAIHNQLCILGCHKLKSFPTVTVVTELFLIADSFRLEKIRDSQMNPIINKPPYLYSVNITYLTSTIDSTLH